MKLGQPDILQELYQKAGDQLAKESAQDLLDATREQRAEPIETIVNEQSDDLGPFGDWFAEPKRK